MACIPVKVARSLKLALQKGDLNVDDLLLKSQDERDAILLKYMDEKQAKSVKEFLIKRYNPELSDELVEEIFTRTEKIKQLRGAEKPVTLEEFTKMEQPPKWALEYVNLNNKIEDVLNPTNNMGLRDTLKFQAKEGIEKINPNIPVITIPDEDQALDYIYENAKHGALYTIMCDVVARALDKIRELKEREEKESDKKVLA